MPPSLSLSGLNAPLWRRRLGWLGQPAALLTLITLAGLVLRLIGLDGRSLWGDELFTIAHALGRVIRPETLAHLGQTFDPLAPQPASAYLHQYFHVSGPWDPAATVRALTLNNHPPLFFWLMRPVIALGGLDPVLLRAPALIFGVACVPMTYLLGKRLKSPPVGLLAAALMALSGYQVFHAQDARPYTLITLIALSTAWLLLTLLAQDEPAEPGASRPEPWRRAAGWLAWSVLCAVGLYTHYFFAPFLAFLLTYGLTRAIFRPRTLLALISAVSLMIIAFLPWLPVLKAQLRWVAQDGHFSQGRWDWIQAPEIIWRMLCEYLAPGDALIRLALPAVLIYCLVMIFWVRRQRLSGTVLSRLAVFCLLWLVFVQGFLVLHDAAMDASLLTVRRYGLLAAPALYLLVANAIIAVKTRERAAQYAIMAGLLGWTLIVSLGVALRNGLTGVDYRSAAQAIASRSPDGRDPTLVNPSGAPTMAMALYLPPQTPLLGLPVRSIRTTQDKAAVQARISAVTRPGVDRLWVAYSDSAPSARLFIEQTLAARQFFPDVSLEFSGLELTPYARGSRR